MPYTINYYCLSHPGKLRKNNQDNFICRATFLESINDGTAGTLRGTVRTDNCSVFGVFDGMGGGDCGEVAANIAAKTIAKYSFEKKTSQMLIRYCREANDRICTYADGNQLHDVGTTAAILVMGKRKIYLCNIGDSKIFRISNGEMQQISVDHVSPAIYGKKPPLFQCLGIPTSEMIISPYVACGEYCDGDIFIICSDGITDMIPQEQISKIILDADPENAADDLLYRALDGGGKDNITLILLYIHRNANNLSVDLE